jgi:hypothetical protein
MEDINEPWNGRNQNEQNQQNQANPINIYLDGNPQITFMKEVYRRYTNCMSHKTKHNFEQNQFVIPVSESIEAIHSIWIKNNPNIKRVSLLVVPNEINMPVQLPNEQIENQNNMTSITDILCRNQKTFLLTDLDTESIVTLEYLRKSSSFEKEIDKNKKKSYLKIPFKSISLVPFLFRENKIVLVLETINNILINEEIIIKWQTSVSREEGRRFAQNFHEYLIRKYQSHTISINAGETSLNPTQLNIPISTVIIRSDKPIDITFNHELGDDNRRFNPELGREVEGNNLKTNKLTEIHSDPEFCSVNLEDQNVQNNQNNQNNQNLNQYTYVLDTLKYDFGEDAQPGGHYLFNQNANIVINSAEDTNVTFTYIMYDIVRIMQNHIMSVLNDNLISSYKNRIFNEKINEAIENNINYSLIEFDELYNNTANDIINRCANGDINISRKVFDSSIINKITHEEYTRRLRQRHPINNLANNPDNNPVDQFIPALIPNDEPNNIDDPIWIPPNDIDEPIFHPPRQDINDETRLINDNMKLYASLVMKMINKFEKESAEPKQLDPETVCEIGLEEIGHGEYYYNCPECKGTFERMSFKVWIESKPTHGKECPKCRKAIKQMPQLYINKPNDSEISSSDTSESTESPESTESTESPESTNSDPPNEYVIFHTINNIIQRCL